MSVTQENYTNDLYLFCTECKNTESQPIGQSRYQFTEFTFHPFIEEFTCNSCNRDNVRK